MDENTIPNLVDLKKAVDHYNNEIEMITRKIKNLVLTTQEYEKNLTVQLQNSLIGWLERFSGTSGDPKIFQLPHNMSKVFEIFCRWFLCTLCKYPTVMETTSELSSIIKGFLEGRNRIIELTGQANDMGCDIVMRNDEKPYCVIQCKKSKSIASGEGNNIVLALTGSMVYINCRYGLLMSSEQRELTDNTKKLIDHLSKKSSHHIQHLSSDGIKSIMKQFTMKISLFMINNFMEDLQKNTVKNELTDTVERCEENYKKLKRTFETLNKRVNQFETE
ncbi:unnamed protein product [Didymodactylos carnosus]|uniref:Restriction endonuclease type IV Mrr domain-containing protein n=1 Tax=Didymodactylos carnosus TaxID=1234261 RepID=A0A8S2SHI4_9BILA|nr:unnamed protein product [Didymodactylos carnosus]CAF4223751.1 unnamed protein product [Didymodactylos carnosus]